MATKVDNIRLAEAIARSGHSQSAVARAAGVTPGAISQLVNGTAHQSRYLGKIAEFLGVSELWLLGESEHSAPFPSELAALPSWSLGTNSVSHWGEPKILAIDPGLIPITANSNFGLFTDLGDAMAPTIAASDRVVVDFDARQIDRSNALWMVGVGGFSMFRRVLPLASDLCRLLTDGAGEPPVELSRAEFVVTGRVACIIKTF